MSLQIGKYIKQALTRSSELQELVGSRIYPVVYDEGAEATYPYVTYASNGINVDETKDGECGDTLRVEIVCVARNYPEMAEVAEAVRTAMNEAYEDIADFDDLPFYVVGQRFGSGPEEFDLEYRHYWVPVYIDLETEQED